jgi:hypothetical protein
MYCAEMEGGFCDAVSWPTVWRTDLLPHVKVEKYFISCRSEKEENSLKN